MARVRLHLKLTMAVIGILLVLCILQHCIFHDTPDVSHHNIESQLHVRDYVFHQEHEDNLASKALGISSITGQEFGEIIIFTDRKKPPKRAKMAHLKTLRGNTPIFVYPPEVDNMISSRLRDYGTWEEDMLNTTGSLFERFPGMTFLDLGCNIGVYSLFIAKLGVGVVSVDPVVDNIKLLSESLRFGKLSKNVTLVNNAISDTRRDAYVIVPIENVGGAYISDDANEKGYPVKTILLDDLSVLLKDQKVFIKMDIEGHEHKALSSGKLFFQSVDVRGILMEWVHHRNQEESAARIIHVLVTNGMLPYEDVSKEKQLNPDRSHRWPENIYWFKR